jgi:hypothetical protein
MDARLWDDLERVSNIADLLQRRLLWASDQGDQLAMGAIHAEIAGAARDRREILARLSYGAIEA